MKPSTHGTGTPPARRPVATAAPDDNRIQAFRDFIDSVDRRDWRAGQLATRRLRSMGLSVVLIKPVGRGGAY